MKELIPFFKEVLSGQKEEVFCEETLIEEVFPHENISEKEAEKIMKEVYDQEIPEIIAKTLEHLGYGSIIYHRKEDVWVPEYLVLATKEDKMVCLGLVVEFDYEVNQMVLLTIMRMDCSVVSVYMPYYHHVLTRF